MHHAPHKAPIDGNGSGNAPGPLERFVKRLALEFVEEVVGPEVSCR